MLVSEDSIVDSNNDSAKLVYNLNVKPKLATDKPYPTST